MTGFQVLLANSNQTLMLLLSRVFNLICVSPLFALIDDDQEGVMDNLLEALKSGSAFNVNRDRKDARKRQPRAAGGTRFRDYFARCCLWDICDMI